MTNLRWLTHLRTSPLVATLYRQREAFKKDIWRQKHEPRFKATESIYLRGPAEPAKNWNTADPCVDYAPLRDKAWLAAKNMIGRIRRAVDEDIAANKIPVVLGDTGKCYIESLNSDSVIDWGNIEKPSTIRLVLTLETNPGATHYVFGQGGHFEVGSLWWLNPLALHSQLNTGGYPVVSFTVDFAVEERS